MQLLHGLEPLRGLCVGTREANRLQPPPQPCTCQPPLVATRHHGKEIGRARGRFVRGEQSVELRAERLDAVRGEHPARGMEVDAACAVGGGEGNEEVARGWRDARAAAAKIRDQLSIVDCA